MEFTSEHADNCCLDGDLKHKTGDWKHFYSLTHAHFIGMLDAEVCRRAVHGHATFPKDRKQPLVSHEAASTIYLLHLKRSKVLKKDNEKPASIDTCISFPTKMFAEQWAVFEDRNNSFALLLVFSIYSHRVHRLTLVFGSWSCSTMIFCALFALFIRHSFPDMLHFSSSAS